MLESDFQAQLIKKIKKLLDGAMVLKNDPNYIQGIPDLIVLYKDKWAFLEVKKSPKASHRPNQDYYVDYWGKFTYTAFINPENEEDILHEMEQALRPIKKTRVHRSKPK